MPFEEIHFLEMSQGNVYRIEPLYKETNSHHYKGVFLCRYNMEYCEFRVKSIYCANIIIFHKFDKYYTFVSVKEQIQKQMEHRALCEILKKITGDPNFVW